MSGQYTFIEQIDDSNHIAAVCVTLNGHVYKKHIVYSEGQCAGASDSSKLRSLLLDECTVQLLQVLTCWCTRPAKRQSDSGRIGRRLCLHPVPGRDVWYWIRLQRKMIYFLFWAIAWSASVYLALICLAFRGFYCRCMQPLSGRDILD